MSNITNTVLLAEIQKLDKRMMAQFKYLIREIHRIEDGRPRDSTPREETSPGMPISVGEVE